jgi:hypothetical protein
MFVIITAAARLFIGLSSVVLSQLAPALLSDTVSVSLFATRLNSPFSCIQADS